MSHKLSGVWSCKIGRTEQERLPGGSDLPMRQAVAAAFRKLTGHDCQFLFSGWDAQLDEGEQRVVDTCWDKDPVHAVHVAGGKTVGNA